MQEKKIMQYNAKNYAKLFLLVHFIDTGGFYFSRFCMLLSRMILTGSDLGGGEQGHLPRKFWSGGAKLQNKLCIFINSFYSFYDKSIK
jgi:hypothetical protein